MRLSGTATLGGEAYRRWSESSLDQVRANLIKAEFLGSGFAPLDVDQVGSVQPPTLLVTGEQSPGLLHRLIDWLIEIGDN